ncbi:EAL domain-containing protein [Sphingomonas sp. 67-36]|nr:EAL domain-containing protein [Sphingomonas sp. 67-36]OJV32626.1 MAG: hypothetical protein BGO24_02480 [Sphingomonas sp. 67-36]
MGEAGLRTEVMVDGNIHYLPLPKARALDSAALSFTLRLENFSQIRHAYGREAAQLVVDEVWKAVAAGLGADAVIDLGADGAIECLIWMQASHSHATTEECMKWLRLLCRSLSLQAIDAAGSKIFPVLSAEDIVSVEAGLGGARVLDAVSVRFSGDRCEASASWAEQYRRDMAAAAPILEAMESGQAGPVLAWQPIRSAFQPAKILYWEGLLREITASGQVNALGEQMEAIERLGYARFVDHHVVSRAIDELDQLTSDIVLAVNVSARSAELDFLWDEVEARLAGRPDLASRLIIELTETSPIRCMTSAVKFIDRMRGLGCRFALDDFGCGFASVRHLMALSPQFVKIDKVFLRCATQGARQRELFKRLVGLAGALGATIIAEGVETEAQSELAFEAGCDWQQGYLWGAPSLSRPRSAVAEPLPTYNSELRAAV